MIYQSYICNNRRNPNIFLFVNKKSKDVRQPIKTTIFPRNEQK